MTAKEKEGFTRIPLDVEDYEELEKIAKERGLTVQQLVEKACYNLLEHVTKTKA